MGSEVAALVRQGQGAWSPRGSRPSCRFQDSTPRFCRTPHRVRGLCKWTCWLEALGLPRGPTPTSWGCWREPPLLSSGGRRHIHHQKSPGPHSRETASLPPRHQAGPARALPGRGAKGARWAASGLRMRWGPLTPRCGCCQPCDHRKATSPPLSPRMVRAGPFRDCRDDSNS